MRDLLTFPCSWAIARLLAHRSASQATCLAQQGAAHIEICTTGCCWQPDASWRAAGLAWAETPRSMRRMNPRVTWCTTASTWPQAVTCQCSVLNSRASHTAAGSHSPSPQQREHKWGQARISRFTPLALQAAGTQPRLAITWLVAGPTTRSFQEVEAELQQRAGPTTSSSSSNKPPYPASPRVQCTGRASHPMHQPLQLPCPALMPCPLACSPWVGGR